MQKKALNSYLSPANRMHVPSSSLCLYLGGAVPRFVICRGLELEFGPAVPMSTPNRSPQAGGDAGVGDPSPRCMKPGPVKPFWLHEA